MGGVVCFFSGVFFVLLFEVLFVSLNFWGGGFFYFYIFFTCLFPEAARSHAGIFVPRALNTRTHADKKVKFQTNQPMLSFLQSC